MPRRDKQSIRSSPPSTVFVLFVVCFLAATGARAETQLQPGLWQETETGSENAKPAKVETTTRCMTAEEAKQPSKAIVFDKIVRQHCKVLELTRTGDDLAFRMQCGTDGFAVNMGANFTIRSPQHYSGTIKASLRLGTFRLTADKKIDAHRVGECKEDERPNMPPTGKE
jgi:hypothetical protein